jgi:excisionase family DNA binding protein
MTTTTVNKTTVNKLLRLTEVAERLDISLPTVRRLVKDGSLQTVRVGRIFRVRPQDLEAYIQSSIKVNAGHATNATGGGDQA